MDDRLAVREDLAGLSPYGAPQLDVPVRLNTNETPYPPPPAFVEDLAVRLGDLELHRYPDRRAWALRRGLGRRFSLPPERVWAASGSNEVLQQLFQAYGGPGRRVLLFTPGYSMHPLLAKVTLTEVVTEPLGEDLQLTAGVAAGAVRRHDPDLVIVASPNNPTGVLVGGEVVRSLHASGRALVVVDEAYVEFAGAAASAVDLLDELPRLVVCRTFSKAWRLAGARLGYLLAREWVVDDLRKVRLPYHLDALVQAAGLAALDHVGAMTDHVAATAVERDRVAGALRDLGARVWPSAANFLLFRPAQERVFERLLERGVLVRDFTSAPGTPGCLRVTIGTPAENDAFLDAFTELTR